MPVRREDPNIAKIYSAWMVSRQLRRIKQKAIEYKGGKCIACGYNKCATSMVFHHRDPSEKDFAIGAKLIKWNRIQNELDKCDLLCLNCHGELHEIGYQQKLAEKEKFIRSIIPAKVTKKHSESLCNYCGKKLSPNNNKYCSAQCKIESSRKIPNDYQTLLNLIKSKKITELSNEFGVTVRAIQKACKKLGINTRH